MINIGVNKITTEYRSEKHTNLSSKQKEGLSKTGDIKISDIFKGLLFVEK